MNEVSTQSAALLLDALDQRGIDSEILWQGLPVSRELLRTRRARIDWETWVEMIDRVEQQVETPLQELWVPGAGRRANHPFVHVANTLLSPVELYRLLARWGVRRAFQVMRANLVIADRRVARMTVTIDRERLGSLPTFKFMLGMLRNLPRIQGYSPTHVVLAPNVSSHRADFTIELPPEQNLLTRASRVVRVLSNVTATLDELEVQADEIAAKNVALEKQLAESRNRDEWLEVALAASNIGLWRWDPAVGRVRVSPQLAIWLGLPGQTEIDTRMWGRLIHPDDGPWLAQLMADALENKKPFEAEYRVTLPSGEPGWFVVKGRIETTADGRAYAFGSTSDVTEKKLMETRLRLADRLIAAGTLAAGVAHEINNPLTYVIGNLDLMQRRLAQHPDARDATRDLLAQVLDGCERIRSVVADVRAFARHDDNAIVPVDLQAVCSAALRIVASDVRHRANVETQFAPDTPTVLANDSRLGQVMINLIVNASQAMPLERATSENCIVIRTRALPSGEACAEVEDNGIGIPADVLPRMFDPFFTTKPVGVGTGLGLSVCQGIITSLGGRIEVESSVGRGSLFRVILAPANRREEASAPPEAEAAAPPSSRILVIDDEPLIRSVVARTLAAQGFAVDEADSGRAGLAQAVNGDGYDAILCDLMMPDIDGVELHDELKRQRPDLASRVVFISGGAVTARTQAFLQTPGVVVLHKPFAFERLLEAIEHAVAQGTSTSLPLT